ncbi:centrosomal protein of 128 kDa isoform X9 [Myiozetetes cayanensis]|uniref:centrosomal protein of 128 kDa isoform X9 n=1 Tax=Myiozetetes cayanensis TaxID=478635 RepID=UPI002160DDD5|nr:centrosomal protein of 128 kDa isoform X9 [Myiozetetes cayanensis]
MANSSSDSDNFLTGRAGRRLPLRASYKRAQNYGAEAVTEKIHTLASTLQDTNRNLRHVDHLLGQYREYNKEQTEAITTLKETLEQSIGQLRSQRLTRNSGMRSASLSSLYPSDLDGEGPSGNRHFLPTSPLRDYGDSQGNKHRRSRSASVRFVSEADNWDQLHSFHQSLRDLSSEQVRLGDDISRELSRRNRTDAELRKTLEELSEKLTESQRQETVSERVERRLQEIEQEMRAERQLVERRQDQLGHMSLQLQEALRKQDAKADETEELMKSKLVKYESEKNQLEQELEQSRKKLNESEGSREVLLHQIEDLRSQLLRAEEDRVELQHQISQAAMHRQSYQDVQDDDRRVRAVAERYEREKQDLEKHILELKAKLNHNAVMSEVEELKRCIERKDKEKAQLVMHIQMELLEEKNIVKTQCRQLEKIKVECDKLTEELTQNEEENIKLKRKCEFVKQELEKKEKQISNEEDHLRKMSEARLQFKDQLRHLEMEQQSILSMIGSEIDSACEVFSRDSVEKFKAISLTPTVLNDPHRWLAETKTKLQWLCEEVKERESKEKKLRCYLLQSREQLKHFTQMKETEHQSLFKQIKNQEKLLEEVHREKRELLEKTHRREEEMGALQERIMTLEMSTRAALDHLESVPEKLSLLEDLKDTGESHCRMEMIEERYMKYKEIVSSLQQQLEDSKQRDQQVKDVKMDAEISDIEVVPHSSIWQTQNNFLSSSLLSDSGSLMKRMVPFDTSTTKEDSTNVAGSEMKLQAEGGKQ